MDLSSLSHSNHLRVSTNIVDLGLKVSKETPILMVWLPFLHFGVPKDLPYESLELKELLFARKKGYNAWRSMETYKEN